MKTLSPTKKLALVILAMTTVAGMDKAAAFGEERVRIQLNDRIRGEGTLHLKRLLREQGYAPRNYELEEVRLIAKSKQGHGSAELFADRRSQDRERIGGNPQDFRLDARHTWDRVSLRNWAAIDDGGPWKIELRGNLKIKAVVIVMDEKFGAHPPVRPPRPPHPPVRPPRPPVLPLPPGIGHGQLENLHLGEEKVDKFITETDTWRLHGENVETLILDGAKGKVSIISVTVVYSNGRRDRLHELTGTLKSGRTKTAHLRGRPIESVIVEATSPNLFGSRGKYAVSADVFR